MPILAKQIKGKFEWHKYQLFNNIQQLFESKIILYYSDFIFLLYNEIYFILIIYLFFFCFW